MSYARTVGSSGVYLRGGPGVAPDLSLVEDVHPLVLLVLQLGGQRGGSRALLTDLLPGLVELASGCGGFAVEGDVGGSSVPRAPLRCVHRPSDDHHPLPQRQQQRPPPRVGGAPARGVRLPCVTRAGGECRAVPVRHRPPLHTHSATRVLGFRVLGLRVLGFRVLGFRV
eukprot:7882080-Pyramimonas_sp.AAC.2